MEASIGLKAQDTVLFIGDSTTDAKRHRQAYRPLGFGYVHFVGNFLWARYPELILGVINAGVSGDTMADLQQRWERDCLAHRLDVLSVLVGVDDMRRLPMEPAFAKNPAAPEQYEVTYEQLLSQTKEQCACPLAATRPFLFRRNQQNAVFRSLAPCVGIVRRLAAEHDAILVPLQQRINQQIVGVPPEQRSDDMVHPYLWAHAWIAQRWLEATSPCVDITAEKFFAS